MVTILLLEILAGTADPGIATGDLKLLAFGDDGAALGVT